jgi:hypothetical protein
MRLVSDEVWRQLDPGAGRLSRRTTRRLWLTFLVGLALYVSGAAAWYSGLVMPQLRWDSNGTSWQVWEDQNLARLTINVRNDGLFPATLVSAGQSAPGFELIGVEGALPVTLRPGDVIAVTLAYRAIDCAVIPPDDWHQAAVVTRPWGNQTVPIRADRPWVIWHELLGEFTCHR